MGDFLCPIGFACLLQPLPLRYKTSAEALRRPLSLQSAGPTCLKGIYRRWLVTVELVSHPHKKIIFRLKKGERKGVNQTFPLTFPRGDCFVSLCFFFSPAFSCAPPEESDIRGNSFWSVGEDPGSSLDDGIRHAAAYGNSSPLPRPQHDVGGRGEPQRERRQLRPELRLLRRSRQTAENVPKGRGRRGGRGQAATCGQRQGEGPNPKRQHGVHRAPDPYSHRAGGQKAVKDRDTAPGLQLHLSSGQRALARRRLRGQPALSQRGVRRAGRWRRKAAPDHLHLLPQQPEKRGEGQQGLSEDEGCRLAADGTEVEGASRPADRADTEVNVLNSGSLQLGRSPG